MRYRNSSGRPLNRRVVLKAAAGFSALALGAASVPPAAPVMAEENGGTRAAHWSPTTQAQPQQRAALRTAAVAGDWVVFPADFAFYALGISWPESVGIWPIIEVQLSTDGINWSDTFTLAAQVDRGPRPSRDNRIFTPLLFSDGALLGRYRTVDADGNPGEVADIQITYIDSTDGPWEKDLSLAPQTGAAAVPATAHAFMQAATATTDDSAPPQIVTRAQWGADESYRYDTYGEIWPPEYITLHHVIIHHTETSNTQDPVVAVRAIYYYHAVDQGWGDIGYNYLVDRNGNIYQGRVGGQNVVGGHSYQYAFGSAGISIIGDYSQVRESDAAKAGLVSIVSWVGRFLDPYGRKDFLEIPQLHQICAHRDVNDTSCPGDMLYADIPAIRDLVAATLDAASQQTKNPGGIIVGDRVRVQTPDSSDLNLRQNAGTSAAVVGTIPNGQTAAVIGGVTVLSDGNWYQLQWSGGTGWAIADYLIVDPAEIPSQPGDLPYGLNMVYTAATNIRNGPSTSESVLQQVPKGAWAFILAGPETRDGYTWYQLRVYQIGDGWSIRDNITPAPVDNAPAGAKFAVGDWAAGSSDINVRTRPGLAQTIIGSSFSGVPFQITQAATGITSHIWYGAHGDKFGGGWVAEDDLMHTANPTPSSTKFTAGDSVKTTDVLNLRSNASTGASIVAVLPTGTTGKVLDGPRAGSGYTWWQIETSYGSGWVVENWLAKTTTSPPPPPPPPPPPGSGKFSNGDTVKTTDALNLRTGASTSSSVIAVLPAGTTGTVVGGPQTGSGYTWWQIKTSSGTGWAVQDWLTKVTTSPPPPPPPPPPPGSGKFANGDAVTTTDALNLRSSPGGSVIAVMPAGTPGTVVGGPQTSGGYTWWQIKTSYGTGWAAQDWLAKSTSSPPPPPSSGGIAKGDTVQVIDGDLNMRSGPGLGYAVVAVLPDATRLTVQDGPTAANGYSWYKVSNASYGTGWCAGTYLQKV